MAGVSGGLQQEWIAAHRFGDGGRERRVFRRRNRIRKAASLVAWTARAWLVARLVADRLNRDQVDRLKRKWTGGLLDVLGVEVVTRGWVRPVPGPLLIISNYLSWLDVCVLSSELGVACVAKSEVDSWPMLGLVASRFGCYFSSPWAFSRRPAR